MGVINTYFAAVDDAAAAATVDAGPAGTHAPTVDGVDASVLARTLLALLLDVPEEAVPGGRPWTRLVSDPEHEAAWVVALPEAFTEALAKSDDERLAAVVGPWAESEEFWGAGDPAQLLPMLREWRDLARAAHDRGQALYCWMAL
ncbi:hypothetical protein [Leucobacter chromiireducens]|uniref:DUF1877 family protein n=1 Tax=Leucobacter chromiireducens subsp. solipictus TaxID=398235 RepID=A0ABS1SIW7_9MICO|nr:hypothetical protein [Leucobacter chromiireducens]MBL3680513.1 hypothetical protein [Leucobacter chromiireducens subsp. solipictus]